MWGKCVGVRQCVGRCREVCGGCGERRGRVYDVSGEVCWGVGPQHTSLHLSSPS